jgi:hypothetical protein
MGRRDMVCPQCGADIPDDARFCPICGADVSPASEAAAPTTATPAAAPPAAAPPAAQPYAPTTPTAAAATPKKKRGLVIAVVVVVALLLCCAGGVAAAFFVPAIRDRMPWAGKQDTPSKPATPTSKPSTTAPGKDDAEIKAAAEVVSAFYAAINSGDLEKIKSTVVADVASQIDAGMFEGWTNTTFEYTRGWIEGTSAYIVGRESQQQYGAGDNGGVKFSLEKSGSAWLISDFQPVDTTQVEGSDTTGSSTGIPGPLNEKTARDLLTQFLQGRQTGAGNIIRRLATEKFLSDNGDVWLDGIDNSEYFTKFTIDSVKISGKSATAVVTETWPDGTFPNTYTLVEQNGAVLVDVWEPQ